MATDFSYESESCDSSSDEEDEIQTSTQALNLDGSDEAAKWRKRVHRRNAIFDELSRLGTLAAVSCGSMLIGWHAELNGPINVEPFSNWKMVFDSSQTVQSMDGFAKGRFLALGPPEYKRLERALSSFGAMIVLAVPDLEDRELIAAWVEFRQRTINNYTREGKQDETISVLKTLSKVCQALLLETDLPDFAGQEWVIQPDGTLGPFSGQLSFISKIFEGAEPRKQFLLEEARALAQVASLSRALPYPSDDQIRESVAKSVETFCKKKLISKSALKQYSVGVERMSQDIGAIRTTRTHSSLSASASYESARSAGGRAAPLVSAAKRFSELPLDGASASMFLGKFDCFGKLILSKQTYGVFLKMTEVRERQCKLGDLLYVDPSEMGPLLTKQRYRVGSEEKAIPDKLGDILNLTASGMILEYGSYDVKYQVQCGVPVFDSTVPVEFQPYTDTLPVRAGLSVEAGLKSRLTTACPAAFVQLSQLVSNRLREHLSKDPFVRVGFEEADKLWEVLKAYNKRWVRKSIS